MTSKHYLLIQTKMLFLNTFTHQYTSIPWYV